MSDHNGVAQQMAKRKSARRIEGDKPAEGNRSRRYEELMRQEAAIDLRCGTTPTGMDL
jgi:hypothetical protein